MYVLDTDICIELLRNNPSVINKIKSLPEGTEFYTTFINVAELFYGTYCSKEPEQRMKEVEEFLSDIEILGIDLKTANTYGRLKCELKRKGQLIADNDLFIASIILAKEAILVTHNVSHYQRIKELKIENWVA